MASIGRIDCEPCGNNPYHIQPYIIVSTSTSTGTTSKKKFADAHPVRLDSRDEDDDIAYMWLTEQQVRDLITYLEYALIVHAEETADES